MRLPGTILACAVAVVATLAVTHYYPGGDAPAQPARVAVTAAPTADASPTPTSAPTVTVTETATTTATVTTTPCVPGFGDRLRARVNHTAVTCTPPTDPAATS